MALPGARSPSRETVISVRGLRMAYGELEAVRGIDLEVRRGEVFAFLSPNGAGKTTTVEVLEGYLKRTGGEVSVLGVDPQHGGPDWRERVGVVLQESTVETDVTVRETLELFAGYYGSPRDVDELIELVGLGGKTEVLGGHLSGGQRRRLDVALALVGDPELVFLDEPTTGFDPSARRAAWEMIAGLQALGKTILGLIQASFASLVVSVVAQRESGILKRRRSTPVRAWVLIAGRALTAVGIAAVMAVILILIGWLVYGATLPGRTIPAIAVTIAVGAVSFCALAYALSSAINSADSAQPVVQFVLLPLYFISGVFVPSADIPHWLLDVADAFPVRHLQEALLKAFNPHTVGTGFAWTDLLVLAIWGVAGLAIAVWRFGWQPKNR